VKTCPHCQRPIQDDVWVCPLCGAAVGAGAAGVGPYAVGPLPTAPQQNSSMALASMICGIIGVVLIPVVVSIPAIILGHLSLSEIKRSAGRIGGRGMAIAGLVLGYLGVAFLPIILIIAAIAIPNLLRARMAANEAAAVGSVRTYNTALIEYASMCPKQGFPPSVEYLGPGNGDCSRANLVDGIFGTDNAVVRGYRFRFSPGSVDADGRFTSFSLNADPIIPGNTGVRHFYSDQTGIIRTNTDGPADAESPPLQ
jgi:type IV pilus assembly protein PilA